MSQVLSPPLRLRKFLVGPHNKDRVIIGAVESDVVLSLTQSEFNLIELINTKALNLADVLHPQVGQMAKISLKDSVELLARLNEVGLLEDPSGSLNQRFASLRDARAREPGNMAGPVKKILNMLRIPLWQFAPQEFSAPLARVCAYLANPLAIAALTLACIPAAAGMMQKFGEHSLQNNAAKIFEQPLLLLISFGPLLALCSAFLVLMEIMVASGLGSKNLRVALNAYGFVFPMFEAHDRSALLLPRRVFFGYAFFKLLNPFICSAASYYLAAYAHSETYAAVSLCFAFIGFVGLCPLFQSRIIYLFEGVFLNLNLVRAGEDYLMQRVLSDLRHIIPAKKDSTQTQTKHNTTLDAWLAVHASIALLWLYVANLELVDVLLAGVPELLIQVLENQYIVERLAAVVLLTSLSLMGLSLATTFIMVPLRNILAVTAHPLRKARRNLFMYKRGKINPSEAVIRFLRDIPLFASLDDATMAAIVPHLGFGSFVKNAFVLNQGEPGSEFFIIADGSADIIRKDPQGVEQFIDHLRAGDSFGEIALIHNTTRQASIRATSAMRVLSLTKKSFDHLFQQGSLVREGLTRFINYSRVIQESQALSHLSPRQIGALIGKSEVVHFQPNDLIVREGTEAADVFIIALGTAQVYQSHHADNIVATLDRGDLVGIIGVLKGITRTANVRAQTAMTCIRISSGDFLEFCMNNLLVAELLGDLSERQHGALKHQTEAS